MSRTVGFAYPGARIQARFGRLVMPAAWDRLQRLDTLGGFLQASRETSLRAWLTQLDAAADAHEIEAQLRATFRRRVAELSAWSPPAWRPAAHWAAVLPDLPAIAALRRGDRETWLQADGAFDDESRQLGASPAPAEAWVARWRRLWPPLAPEERRALEQLVTLLRAPAAGAEAGAKTAQALQRPLRRLFRRHTRAPAGLFAWLALCWIELARLRGALLRRRLGLPPEGAPA